VSQALRRACRGARPSKRALQQGGLAHQVAIDAARRLASLPDRPDDQRLPAAEVAAGEHAGNARHVVGVRLDVAARVELDAEVRQERALLRPQEPQREEDEVALELELAARDLDHLGRTAVLPLPLQAHPVQLLHVARGVAGEGLGVDAPVARNPLLVRRRGAQDHRPVGPRSHVLRSGRRRHR
jgi:hypothetical protein